MRVNHTVPRTPPGGGTPLGLEVGFALLGTHQTVGHHAGRVVMIALNGPREFLVTLDTATPAACARCGHDDPRDPSRRLDGDHLVLIESPGQMTTRVLDDPSDSDRNAIRIRAELHTRTAWCSQLPQLPPATLSEPS